MDSITNNLIPFDYQGAPLRTIDQQGGLWFVAADVCRILDLGNVSQALTRLDADEATLISNEGREINVVSEAGLYSLILGSRKPEAKTFKRWVTHEVLPILRKTGAYAVPSQPDWTIPKTLPEALRLAATALEALEEAKPKVEFYNAVVADDSWFTLQRAAGVLNIPGLGRTNLFRFLREEEIFTPGNVPYRRFIEEGHFRLQDVRTPVGVKSQPMVSQKGIDFILKRWNKAQAVGAH